MKRLLYILLLFGLSASAQTQRISYWGVQAKSFQADNGVGVGIRPTGFDSDGNIIVDTTNHSGSKLDTSATYISNIIFQNSGLFHISPATYNYSNHTATLVQTLANQQPYTLFGRASGVGQPSALIGIDSNWVTGLHTQNYYNGFYGSLTQQQANTSAINTKVGSTTDNALAITGTAISTKKAWNTITWASAITINAATSMNQQVTLGGATSVSFSGGQDGDIVALMITQDATGSRTITWESRVDWSATNTGNAPTLKTAGSSKNLITFTFNSAANKWYGIY